MKTQVLYLLMIVYSALVTAWICHANVAALVQ
jgi:hypothetical protein